MTGGPTTLERTAESRRFPRIDLRLAAVLLVALLVAALATYAAARVNAKFYQRFPLIGDTSSYFLFQQEVWLRTEAIGKYRALLHELLTNNRNPGLYLSYFFLPRSLLLTLNGHLFYTGAALVAFLATFAVCVWKRTGSLGWSAAAVLLPFVADGLFDPIYQMPSKLPDIPAAFFVGAALFSLLNSERGRSLPWLALFGAFASFALLSRFIAAGYLFVICAPIYVSYIIDLARREKHAVRRVALALATTGAVILLFAGWTIATGTASVLYFYGHAGYSLNSTLEYAVTLTAGKFVRNFLGPLGIAAYVTLFSIQLTQWRLRADTQSFLEALWAASSHIVMVVLVLRVYDDAPQLVYAWPGLLLLAAAPFAIAPEARPSYLFRGAPIAGLGAGLAAASFLHYAIFTNGEAMYPREDKAQLRRLHHELADIAVGSTSGLGRVPTIEADFEYFGRYITATALLDYGKVLRYDRIFEIRESQWTLNDPNASREAILARTLREIDRRKDILFLLDDPQRPEAMTVLHDEYTRHMAEDLKAHVEASPEIWRFIRRVDSPWGPIAAYRNISPRK